MQRVNASPDVAVGFERERRLAKSIEARRLRTGAFWFGMFALCLELAACVILTAKAVQAVNTARDLHQRLISTLHTVGAENSGLNQQGVDALRQSLQHDAADAARLSAAVQFSSSWLCLAQFDARPREELRQTGALIGAIQDGSQLGIDSLTAYQDVVTSVGAASVSGRPLAVIGPLAKSVPALSVDTANLSRDLANVRGGTLAQSLQSTLTPARNALPLLSGGLQLLASAPNLLGASNPVSYLIVAQNPADLRPTGGYMGSWGVLTFQDGHVKQLDYRAYDQWESFDVAGRVWPAQTTPVQHYFNYCCMAMQDANWYPDYPTTALVLEQFARADQSAPIRGVIALDPAIIQALLAATGPVDLTDLNVHVTADNVVTLANQYEGRGANVTAADLQVGKRFLIEVAQVLLQRLSSGQHLASFTLLEATLQALQQKHLIVALNDPSAASAFARLGWDGAQATPTGDYVMVDDMSFSDNKVDESVSRQFSDTVQLRADGSADVTLNIHWQNAYPLPTQQGAGSGANLVPTTAMRDFFRVYLPPGASVKAVAGVDELWPTTAESGHVVAQGFVIVPQNGSSDVTVRYAIPAAVVATSTGPQYQLTVQIQPGIPPSTFDLRLLLPDGSVLFDQHQQLVADRQWRVPTNGRVAAGIPVPPLSWNRTCAALELVRGLQGPNSAGPLVPPNSCSS